MSSTTPNTVSPSLYADFVNVSSATFTPSLCTSYDAAQKINQPTNPQNERMHQPFFGIRVRISTASRHPVKPPSSSSSSRSNSTSTGCGCSFPSARARVPAPGAGNDASSRFAYSRKSAGIPKAVLVILGASSGGRCGLCDASSTSVTTAPSVFAPPARRRATGHNRSYGRCTCPTTQSVKSSNQHSPL